MKFQPCDCCEARISPNAEFCPHCGEPKATSPWTPLLSHSAQLLGTILLIISVCYWGCDIDLLTLQPFLYLVMGGIGISLLLKSWQMTH